MVERRHRRRSVRAFALIRRLVAAFLCAAMWLAGAFGSSRRYAARPAAARARPPPGVARPGLDDTPLRVGCKGSRYVAGNLFGYGVVVPAHHVASGAMVHQSGRAGCVLLPSATGTPSREAVIARQGAEGHPARTASQWPAASGAV